MAKGKFWNRLLDRILPPQIDPRTKGNIEQRRVIDNLRGELGVLRRQSTANIGTAAVVGLVVGGLAANEMMGKKGGKKK